MTKRPLRPAPIDPSSDRGDRREEAWPTRRAFITRSLRGLIGTGLGVSFLSIPLAGPKGCQEDPDPEPRCAPVDVPQGRVRNVVFLNMNGGMSHVDIFDIKEHSKEAYYNFVENDPSVFAQIEPYGGLELNSAFFPYMTQMLRSGDAPLAFIRMAATSLVHERGQYQAQTGHLMSRTTADIVPHLGAMMSYKLLGGTTEGLKLPPFSTFYTGTMAGQGFLPTLYGPVQLNDYWLTHPEFAKPYYLRQGDPDRHARRLARLLEMRGNHALPMQDIVDDFDAAYAHALYIAENFDSGANVQSQLSLADFNSRYGENNFGRGCFLAAKLIKNDAGPRAYMITQGGWDLHVNLFANQGNLCRILDQGVTALIEDLDAAGKLDETVIVLVTEFGRTISDGNHGLNQNNGRDHHRDALTLFVAGGGLKGNTVLGTTTDDGRKIADPGWSLERPITVIDLFATIYYQMGIDYHEEIPSEVTGSSERFALLDDAVYYDPQTGSKLYDCPSHIPELIA